MLKKDELVPDFTFADLLQAYYDCRKRKRNTYSALKFEVNLEKNLLKLYADIKSGKYEIGRYICFIVTSPKPREVWAACFRDRIVHHLVYNAIKDRFHKRFIKDTYSCIPERGTLACANTMLRYARSASRNYKKKTYYLKADLSNFFVSIDKNILFDLLCEYVKEDWILELLKIIVFHDPRKNVYVKSSQKLFNMLPKRKSLWHTPNSHGLPIGNLTSQFFSNVYLNVLDQYVKTKLCCRYYCRYVDDFIILGYSPKELCRNTFLICDFIKTNLGLELNPKKCFIDDIVKGIDCVGFSVRFHHLVLRKKILKKIFSIVKKWFFNPKKYEYFFLRPFYKTVNSYLGMMRKTASYMTRYCICKIFRSLFIFSDSFYQKAIIPAF